ncbi:TPA: hypothetical protein ACN331_002549 [Vibrio parahaemolyticus]
MASTLHDELCIRGKTWLKNTYGCQTAFKEIDTTGGEQPDCFGIRHGLTILIEVKTSKSDYLADFKKPWRQEGKGMGQVRYYLTPKGLLNPKVDLPKGWGLLEATAKQIKVVAGINPRKDDLYPIHILKSHPEFIFESRDTFSELYLLNSVIRRIEVRVGDVQQFTKEHPY